MSQEINKFGCCGGTDENPKEHTQDCDDHGNKEWKDRVLSNDIKTLLEDIKRLQKENTDLKAALHRQFKD